MIILITLHRDLLFSTFLMGDGNFHLQLRTLCKSIQEDPSLYGDTGFWAMQQLYTEYTEAANKLTINEPKASQALYLSRFNSQPL